MLFNNRKSYACVGEGVYGKTLPFSQFCYIPKIAVKIVLKLYLFRKNEKIKLYNIFK